MVAFLFVFATVPHGSGDDVVCLVCSLLLLLRVERKRPAELDAQHMMLSSPSHLVQTGHSITRQHQKCNVKGEE